VNTKTTSKNSSSVVTWCSFGCRLRKEPTRACHAAFNNAGAYPRFVDNDQRLTAFHSALVTEHFVLQSQASATISESSSRSSLYLLSLSSGLVALSFSLQASKDAFAPFAAAVLPTLFLLGWFTVVRLVDTSIENVQALRGIARIRGYYAALTPEAPTYFPSTGSADTDAQYMLGTSYRPTTLLFTMASMVGTVNAVVGGAMAALLLEGVLALPRTTSLVVAVAVAVALLGAVLRYERRRFSRAYAP